MATEIERKFLVTDTTFLEGRRGVPVVQGYLAKDTMTVRVRTMGEKAFLTLKGPFVGIARDEYEYEIPCDDAHELLSRYCPGCIVTKTRFLVPMHHMCSRSMSIRVSMPASCWPKWNLQPNINPSCCQHGLAGK